MKRACFLGLILVLAFVPPAEPVAWKMLERNLGSGQAIIWYLFHSGWAVKTQHHLLIFDYTEPSEVPSGRSLDSGSIEPSEIADQNVTVFVSHGHSDHYDRRILDWRSSIRNIRYVWGWQGEGLPEDIHFGSERREIAVDGLEILNVHHEFDGIPESAFLVRTDGLTILHAGDHGHSRGLENQVFRDNLHYLAERAPRLDVVFLPTFGGEIDALRLLRPRAAFPMHDGGRERQYDAFSKRVRTLGLDVAVGAARKRGDRFFYSQGTLSQDGEQP
jgi:L-ascorbate metabolism protein UlaG (beta-lactamase superfamily)